MIPIAHRRFHNIHILDSQQSIHYIIDNQCSVSRYGDGEFIMMLGGGYEDYQEADKELASALQRVMIENNAPNHVIGLPLPLKTTTRLCKSSHEFWDYFVLRNCKSILQFLSSECTYIDTQLSRFYIMYKDKSNCSEQLALLKKIWDGKDIVIIEGCKSRTGVGNDLYSNARSINRILGPATDAFSMYEKMLETIKQKVSKDKLILLSYGPTATVLAYDLAKIGYWAIDIGHLDIEYEWFLNGAVDKVAIRGKFTNEDKQRGHIVADCADREYLQQIICNIAI